ncbi:E3 ubiquitin-conjugating enzyme FATS [Camelus dromedarius]|uniref:E3 ubiquitin-conjugating enzyme FATS n=1 Tax=Camelus dromedarius TaxID=9838 RepID=A0A5N4DL30_CAMDR|nr:E3 ubiquitin-conjugating enzyme FATS [Camelus dromedarius]
MSSEEDAVEFQNQRGLEALEVRKPQFISRSQERLKKLEHMVQQRKAQQNESPRPKQSLLPVRANKKQFTVPHPLSGKLQVAGEG